MTQAYPSYPYPDPSRFYSQLNIHPRPLRPLQAPPPALPLPHLPSPIRDPFFTSSYTLTTHLCPSAFPHAPSVPLSRASYAEIIGETKEARIARQKAFAHLLWTQNRAQAQSEVNSGGEPEIRVFWNVINRFVRRDAGRRPGGLTLFLAHANGFPKEIWEPSLAKIFSQIETENIVIDEVWAFEAVQHGDSALVNDHILGNVFDWADNARDILNFLLYYLPDTASPARLLTHLPRLPDDLVSQRRASGYASRTLVGIGHSLGGCCTARAAIDYPALFSSLILVDPVITPRSSPSNNETGASVLAVRASLRRSTWGSREEALTGFQKSHFFSAWDPAVLEKYVQYALAPDPGAGTQGSVRLKMSGAQEAIVFIERRLSYETWHLIPQLDERIELYYILSGKDTSATGGEHAVRELPWRRPRNASNVLIPSAGHLIPQEVPHEFAILVSGFLKNKYTKGETRKAML